MPALLGALMHLEAVVKLFGEDALAVLAQQSWFFSHVIFKNGVKVSIFFAMMISKDDFFHEDFKNLPRKSVLFRGFDLFQSQK